MFGLRDERVGVFGLLADEIRRVNQRIAADWAVKPAAVATEVDFVGNAAAKRLKRDVRDVIGAVPVRSAPAVLRVVLALHAQAHVVPTLFLDGRVKGAAPAAGFFLHEIASVEVSHRGLVLGLREARIKSRARALVHVVAFNSAFPEVEVRAFHVFFNAKHAHREIGALRGNPGLGVVPDLDVRRVGQARGA